MRKIFGSLLTAWLGFMIFHGLGLIDFGTAPISLGWIGAVCVGVATYVMLDWRLGFRSTILGDIYAALLAFFFFFNLALIFDWYEVSPLVNRAEHLFGAVLLTAICWGVLIELGLQQVVKQRLVQVFFLAGIVALGSIFVEIVELFIDFGLGEVNVGPDPYDTSWDLLMDMLGLSLVLIVHKLSNGFQRTDQE